MFESLEPRRLLSRATLNLTIEPDATGSVQGFTPAQIAHAYGFDQITFSNGTVNGTGAGQTIAIVDAYNDPDITADLGVFDQQFNLSAPPSFNIINQSGGTSLPASNSGWAGEISLDVEWAHAMAPQANILLVEANSSSIANLMAAVNEARNSAGVSVVSMSWGGAESQGFNGGESSSQLAYDPDFTTPSGHTSETFVAASGDEGTSGGVQWPASSPNVISVGGTTLSVSGSSDAYAGETGWIGSQSGTSGGFSKIETEPTYQDVVQTTGKRSVPDVAYDANPSTGFAIYDSDGSSGWELVGGTSAGAPQWSALIAIADQGRAILGQGTLAGATQTLPDLYGVYSAPGTAGFTAYTSVFHDVGNNGYTETTGLGSPEANAVVAVLDGTSTISDPGPTVSAGPNQTIALPATTATLTGSLSESTLPSGGSLSSTWTKVSGPGAVTFANPNSAKTTVTITTAGSYVLQLAASDGTVTNDSTVTVTVTPDPGPVVSAGANQTISLPNVAQLAGNVSQTPLPQGVTLSSTWSELSGPGSTDFANANSPLTTVSMTTPGSYVLQLAATDGLVTKDSTVTITVNPDPGPVVSAGANQTVALPNAAQLSGSVSQSSLPQGVVLSATWSELSGPGAVIFADANSAAATVTFPAAGVYVLELAGSDGFTTNTSQVSITVFLPATISGSVTSALNGASIASRTVYVDANQDGQLESGEISATTDASGNFTLSDVPAGTYPISQVLPAGATSADPSDNMQMVSVAAGQTLNGVLFADLPAPASSGPSLAATFVKALPPAVIGGTIGTATIKITNDGNAIATGAQTLTLMSSTTGGFSASNVVVSTVSLGSLKLNPNASKTITVKFNYPANLASGSYSLLAVPDSSNSAPQTSFHIAESSSVIIAPPFTQLQGSLAKVPQAVKAGKNTSVTVGVSNTGNEAFTAPLTVSLYESLDPTLDSDDVLLGTLDLSRSDIKAAGHATFHVALKTPTDVTAGNEYILAVVNGSAPASSTSTVAFN